MRLGGHKKSSYSKNTWSIRFYCKMVVVGGIKMVPNKTNSFSILITVACFLLYLNYIIYYVY